MKTIIENPSKKRLQQLDAEGQPYTLKNNVLFMDTLPIKKFDPKDKPFPDMRGANPIN